jgi:hypothetical protein
MKGHAVKFPQRLYHLTLCFRTLAQVEGRAEVCSRKPANKGSINRKHLHLLKMFIRWMQEQRRLNSLRSYMTMASLRCLFIYAKGWNEVIEVANPNECHAIMLRISPCAKDVYPMTIAQV